MRPRIASTTRRPASAIGVDFAQGHAVGRPVDLDDALAALTEPQSSETA